MKKRKEVAAALNPYTKQFLEEEREKLASVKREMLLLTRKVGRNPLAAGYYIQIKDLLEDLMMLELAQKAAESTMKFDSANKIITIDDASLGPFRAEMEKAKMLKLVAGVLSLSGCLNVEDTLDKVTSSMYGPRIKDKKSKDIDVLSEVKKIVDSYSKKLEKALKDQNHHSTKS